MGQQFTIEPAGGPTGDAVEKTPDSGSKETLDFNWVDELKPNAEASPAVDTDLGDTSMQESLDAGLKLTVTDIASGKDATVDAGTALGDVEVEEPSEAKPENADPEKAEPEKAEPKEVKWTGEPPSGTEQSTEKGTLYMDESTGFANGIRFTEGERAGQEYQFKRDAAGNVTELSLKVHGGEGEDVQEIKFARAEGGSWQLQPPEARDKVPGFQNLKFKEGDDGSAILEGDFEVTADGTMKYNRGDGITEVLRPNGIRDVFDFNEYSRIREVDGQSVQQYWDGYEWRAGAKDPENPDTIVFSPAEEGKPTRMVRDGDSDTFKVEFSDGLTFNADWRNNKMTRSGGPLPDVTLYPTSHLNSKGNQLWMAGVEKETADGSVRIEFQPENADQRSRMASGELPVETVLRADSDEIKVKYGNGSEVISNSKGEVSRVEHYNGQQVELTRDISGRIIRIEGLGGRTFERQGVVGEGAAQTTRWSVTQNGEQQGTFDADLDLGSNGSIKLHNLGGSKLELESSGRFSIIIDGKPVSAVDAQGQSWERLDPAEGSDKERWKVTTNGEERVFEGELKLLDKGVVAVETAEGKIESVNRDGSEWVPPGDGELAFPPRQPGSELGGKAFFRDVLGVDPEGGRYQNGLQGVEREQKILEQIEAGNIPDFLRHPKKVVVQDGNGNTAELSVMPDYLAIGTNEDWVRVPITPVLARAIADRYGLELPTRKVADAIYEQADKRVTAEGMVSTSRDQAHMTGNGFYFTHNAKIEEALGNTPDDALVAGHKKDLIYSRFAENNPNRLDYYGFFRANGTAIQGAGGGAHDNVYVDYSHGARFIAETVVVNGEPMKYADVLKNPDLAGLLGEGTMNVDRIYSSPKRSEYNVLLAPHADAALS